jgi:PAS domain S-box-containing protein
MEPPRRHPRSRPGTRSVGLRPEILEEAFAGLFHRSPIAKSLTRVRDGLLVEVNDRFLALLGLERSATVGRSSIELGLWPEPSKRQAMVQCLETSDGVLEHWVTHLRATSGELREVALYGETIDLDGEAHVLCQVVELTEPEKTRLELARYADIVHNMQIGLYVWRRHDPSNPESFELVLANPAAEVHTGKPNRETVGKWTYESFPSARHSMLVGLFTEVLASGRGRDVGEVSYTEENGSLTWYSTKVFPVAPDTIAVTFENTTDRREEKEAIQRLEQQLLHAQKMEAVGRLAGGIAHDFNSLLTAVLGHTELVLDQLGPGHEARRGLLEIQRAGERAAALTRQLLSVSRHQFLEPVVLDVNELIGRDKDLLASLNGESVELRMVPAPEPLRVRADPAQVEQVLLNLVVNAKDAMPDGGELTIRTSLVEIDPAEAARHPEGRPGRFVCLSVVDTGCGMDPHTQAHIFEPFFTTKQADKGTGLGLSTVYGIVHQSGGFIAVESSQGQGSRFDVFLPVTDGAPAARAASWATAEPVAARREATILIAEDEDLVRSLLTDLLVHQGYRVLPAAHGPQALELSRGHYGNLDLLVTDLVMPRMSGLDLARRLLEERPGLPVLFMSGHAGDTLSPDCTPPPGAVTLRKPFTPAVLLQQIVDLLEPSA